MTKMFMLHITDIPFAKDLESHLYVSPLHSVSSSHTGINNDIKSDKIFNVVKDNNKILCLISAWMHLYIIISPVVF